MSLQHRLKPSHLRLILRIAEASKLQIAAEASGMSQPAASRLLSEIEAEVGAPLFQRLPRGMVPTREGVAFVKHARAILAQYDTLESELGQLGRGQAGAVRIGSVTGPAVGCLVPALKQVRDEAPDIEVTVEVAPSVDLVRGLEEGRFDFILARFPPGHDARAFAAQPARTEAVALLARSDHPLAAAPRARLKDLARFDWVMQERGSPIRQAVEAAFRARGLAEPARVTNSASLLVALAMVEAGETIAPMTREAAELLIRMGARCACLKPEDSMTVAPYFVIRNRSQAPTRAVERVMAEVMRRL
ncbi:LysR substrate-binding domain-containing protein [Tropicibacter oceani]|uniref:LysR substrate-binding domain-containing protein n=1 Tax=Tropicibacter oceani TaxID=3058420 RepID=A0ABY8QG34_9RHOB|nr:LysR substrate-binding domain-containing protein [Tropicibacter oceani]WGW03555.1 LysR substrate-binding domain-containing protein [Tropicibacter oceani]